MGAVKSRWWREKRTDGVQRKIGRRGGGARKKATKKKKINVKKNGPSVHTLFFSPLPLHGKQAGGRGVARDNLPLTLTLTLTLADP